MKRVLERIESDTKLAQLFNAYMSENFTIQMMFDPFRYSMAEYNRERVFEEKQIQFAEEIAFQYHILTNSLHSIHNNVLEAVKAINKYQNEFGSDWKYFASTKRIEDINEYGGMDSDFNEKGEVIFRDDNESLKYSTIHHELGLRIEYEETDSRGEFIGTSDPSDFERFSNIIKNSNDFDPLSFFREQGKEIPVYTQGEDGEMKPLSTIDRIEMEMNEDIINGRIVELFNLVLLDCQGVSKYFQSINPFSDSKEQYAELLNRLETILNLNYKLK